MSVVRIAFPLIPSKSWMGGYNYLLSLVSALVKYESKRVQPVLFYGSDALLSDIEPFKKLSGLIIVEHHAFIKKTQTVGLLQALILGKNFQVTKAFSDKNIDVVFEPARFYGWRLKQSCIAWFPDFQHRYMPHLFSRLSWLKRESGFKMQINSKRAVLLSSDDAKKDCKKFYTIESSRIAVIKFPTVISKHLLDVDFSTFKTQYTLPEKFIYVPNQFWLHKNHMVLIEALALLQSKGKVPTIICTGNTQDPRSSDHFSLLQKKITQLNLADHFRILGLIPREHALALLRSCTLLINPSFFEGWNTGVEEAKAFNVPMLLSNIDVHQEQASNTAQFFDPNSAKNLAKMVEQEMIRLTPPNTERLLNQNTDDMVEKFASAFANLTLSV